jgi:hypothetical protein
MITPDQIGRVGELVVELTFNRLVGASYNRCLFRPNFLGEKYPTVDFFVDVLDDQGDAAGFFFAQVRSTMQAATSGSRLSINVDVAAYNRLVALPIPTYLIGVDGVREAAYVVAAFKRRTTGVSGITTAFNLTHDAVKVSLYEEVCRFWRQSAKLEFQSEFNDG